MKRIRLGFDVKDRDYFDNLIDYIRLNYGRYFHTDVSEDARKADYLISDHINKRNRKNVIIIKDGGGDIEKYKKASSICSDLFEICSFNGGADKVDSGQEAHVICVTSAAGGAGKSTVAKALACRMAEKGVKVLYMDMNPMSSGEPPFLTKGKNPVTELFCLVYGKDDSIAAKVKTLSRRDEKRRVDYITNARPSTDGFFNREEAEFFMDNMRRREFYRTMVLDVPAMPTDGYMEILKNASNVIFVKGGSENKRQENMMEYLKEREEVTINEVDNFSDSGGLALPRSRNIFNDRPDKFWNGIDRIIKMIGN